jgi:hypothetical protein
MTSLSGTRHTDRGRRSGVSSRRTRTVARAPHLLSLVLWPAIEAISKNHGDDPIKEHCRRVVELRGRNKVRVAAARKLLTMVYYGLRDGEIRSLAPPEATGGRGQMTASSVSAGPP